MVMEDTIVAISIYEGLDRYNSTVVKSSINI